MVRRLAGKDSQLDPAQVAGDARDARRADGVPVDAVLARTSAQLLHGDFGVSYTYFPFSVTEVIGQAMRWTVGPGHRHAGARRSSSASCSGPTPPGGATPASTRVVTLGSTFLGTLQPFWIALLLLYVFGYTLGWFPTSAATRHSTPGCNCAFIQDALSHASLPAVALLIVDADRLDPRDAQHDDHEPGRGLHPAGQGQGAARPHRRPAVRRPQRAAAERHRLRPRPRRRARRHDPRRDGLRLPRPRPADGRGGRQQGLPAAAGPDAAAPPPAC